VSNQIGIPANARTAAISEKRIQGVPRIAASFSYVHEGRKHLFLAKGAVENRMQENWRPADEMQVHCIKNS
jgi:hypothetical protein